MDVLSGKVIVVRELKQVLSTSRTSSVSMGQAAVQAVLQVLDTLPSSAGVGDAIVSEWTRTQA